MRVVVVWDIPDALRNALLRHLHDFDAAHAGCSCDMFVQSTPTVPVAEILRESAASVSQIFEGQSRSRLPDAGPQPTPFERAKAAILAHPGLSARAIAKLINASHQTVIRAKADLRRATAPAVVQGQDHGPRGPERHRGRRP